MRKTYEARSARIAAIISKRAGHDVVRSRGLALIGFVHNGTFRGTDVPLHVLCIGRINEPGATVKTRRGLIEAARKFRLSGD